MTTIALEGVGSTIGFGTSTFTSDLISLTLPERSREALDTSHLGTTTDKTYIPAKLPDPGQVACSFDWNPDATQLVDQDAEVITITLPLLSGQTTPSIWSFTGFVVSEGGMELAIDGLTRQSITIQITGDITRTPAT